MLGILLAVHVLITMLLIFVILIQKSEGGSSLFASGAGNGMFTARGTSDILTKSSWVLATIFLGNCIVMAHISSKEIKETNSIIVNQRLAKAAKKSTDKNSPSTHRQSSDRNNKSNNIESSTKNLKNTGKPVSKPMHKNKAKQASDKSGKK